MAWPPRMGVVAPVGTRSSGGVTTGTLHFNAITSILLCGPPARFSRERIPSPRHGYAENTANTEKLGPNLIHSDDAMVSTHNFDLAGEAPR